MGGALELYVLLNASPKKRDATGGLCGSARGRNRYCDSRKYIAHLVPQGKFKRSIAAASLLKMHHDSFSLCTNYCAAIFPDLRDGSA